MPNNNEDEYSVLKWRVKQLEDLVKPLIDMVNALDKKVGLLAQKILIATVLIGGSFQVFSLWYSNRHSEDDKKSYYEMRVNESEKVKELQLEIDRLRRGVRQ